MHLKPFAQTGLPVTPLGLGLAALGRPGYINLGHADDLNQTYEVAAMERHAHAVLDAAWEAGMRYFDAARSYGRAEAFLGSWLTNRAISPSAVTVGSKWGYTYTANWQVTAEQHEVKDHSLPVLQRQIGESRHLLGPYLKLYQIHSATLDSHVLTNQAVLEELTRLKSEGMRIGLSLSGERQADTLRRALAIRLPRGGLLFDTVQATWNLLEPSAGEMLAAAHTAGLGVIVKEALANGRLTSRNSNPRLAPLRQWAEAKGASMDAVALAAALAQPWADIVLSGATTIAHIKANMGALYVDWDEETAVQLARLAESPQQYWQTRSRLAWN